MVYFLRLFFLAMLVHGAVYGAELAGIWMGETTGRNGEKQDIAFQFKIKNGRLTGVMFSDEVDLPLEELKVEQYNVSFSVTNVNYYSGSRRTVFYSGTLTEKELCLTRDRKSVTADDRQSAKQDFILKRVTP